MNKQYLLQLMLADGIGEVSIKKILHYVRTNEDEFSLEFLCQNPEYLSKIISVRTNTIKSVVDNKDNAIRLYKEILEQNVMILTEDDLKYPKSLKSSLGNKCPPVLFAKGNIDLLNNDAVGFCGSRKVSQKGAYITDQCAKQFANRNITVVSGYAAGTDLYAHSSALINNGNTIFVLAEGILKYSLKQGIKDLLTFDNHVFVSQFIPNSSWSVGNAMKRNSLIIGLSKAMILVESGKKGGTFAAGEETLKRNLPLFVIDFEKPEVSAEANPYFINKGGFPIRGKQGIPNLINVFRVISGNITADSKWDQGVFEGFDV